MISNLGQRTSSRCISPLGHDAIHDPLACADARRRAGAEPHCGAHGHHPGGHAHQPCEADGRQHGDHTRWALRVSHPFQKAFTETILKGGRV